jgi:hypothetical protein
LLTESKRIGRELTNDFYRDYRQLREQTFKALRQHNRDRDPAKLLAATQKLLDRILFISFAEDRELLPRDSIKHAYEHEDVYDPKPVWDLPWLVPVGGQGEPEARRVPVQRRTVQAG